MKTIVIAVITSVLICSCASKNNLVQDSNEIMNILNQQEEDWNNNDLEGFMEGYWKSESLFFYSGAKLKSGWITTLMSYKKKYPDKSYAGTLNFKIIKISPINTGAYFVMGEYELIREVGDANGTFMIIFKRIDGKWKIIADSSC
ncbi:nuclear transport factor 2 family protein [Maribacter sp. ACAM166]|uniref:nuclear transport factor 2 family protein n=1 Tax=Maribacter sp. ACAM166 TaxID=2508996 RepID=UPI0010FEE5B6|nr:nuclear transport factor 2 family protein [Maribacter sp. ACAM166]TLP79620.1 nuclear transport factor 2 family protein [Maribacter sp. ACAM166]